MSQVVSSAGSKWSASAVWAKRMTPPFLAVSPPVVGSRDVGVAVFVIAAAADEGERGEPGAGCAGPGEEAAAPQAPGFHLRPIVFLSSVAFPPTFRAWRRHRLEGRA